MLEKEKGAIDKATGVVQDAAGNLLGDSGLQLQGKAKQVAGQVQQSYGNALEQVRDFTSSTPIAALAVIGAVGFVLGALVARS